MKPSDTQTLNVCFGDANKFMSELKCALINFLYKPNIITHPFVAINPSVATTSDNTSILSSAIHDPIRGSIVVPCLLRTETLSSPSNPNNEQFIPLLLVAKASLLYIYYSSFILLSNVVKCCQMLTSILTWMTFLLL